MGELESLRHLHFSFTEGVKILAVVLVFGAAWKYLLNRYHVPGLTELTNYVI